MRKSSRNTKRQFKRDDLTGVRLPDVQRFGTGEVAEILDLKMWRLQKFLDSPRFQLSASGHIGKGQGSRRLFTREDVYRLGIAAFLTRDGFGPKLVSEVLQRVEDRDLTDFDEDSTRVHWQIVLRRGGDEPEIELCRSGNLAQDNTKRPIYYAIGLADLTGNIDERIGLLEKSGRR